MAAARPERLPAARWLLSCTCLATALGTLAAPAAGSAAASSGLVAGASHLLLMVLVPWGLWPHTPRHGVTSSALALLGSMALLRLMPTLLPELPSAHRLPLICLLLGAAIMLAAPLLRARMQPRAAPAHPAASDARGLLSAPPFGYGAAPLALALLAGLCTGGMARVDLSDLCGPSGDAGSLAGWALSLSVVAAGAVLMDRGHLLKVLALLYGLRALLLVALGSVELEVAARAPTATQLLLALDCLTLPALLRLAGPSCGLAGMAGPGLAHHLGMGIGAALATAPYFFGDSFALPAFVGAALSLSCVLCLCIRPMRASSATSSLPQCPTP
jgi:hypothetical protein